MSEKLCRINSAFKRFPCLTVTTVKSDVPSTAVQLAAHMKLAERLSYLYYSTGCYTLMMECVCGAVRLIWTNWSQVIINIFLKHSIFTSDRQRLRSSAEAASCVNINSDVN